MATKITAAFEYTDVELLALVREAIATVTKFGTSYTIGNRTFNREHLDELRKLQSELEQRISRVATGMAYNLARRARKP